MAREKYQNLDKYINNSNPRDKLIEFGPAALKDHELLSNIFMTGYNGEDSIELSSRILSEYGAKPILRIKSVQEIMEVAAIPPAKSCQLLSALELGKRFFSLEYGNFPTIRSPKDAYECFKHMENYKRETLEAVYLNVKNKVIHREVISIGTLEKTIIEPAEIFEPAIGVRALGIIIAHNHPSGDFTPSEEDLEKTNLICRAGEILKRPILDHLIIGQGGYYSILQKQGGCDFE